MATSIRQLVHYYAHPHRLAIESSYHRLVRYFEWLVNYFVPAPSDRIPITHKSAPYSLIPFILLLTMGYLVRRPGTWLIRLAIMPFALAATFRTAFGYEWMHVDLDTYNFGSGYNHFVHLIGLAGLAGATKAIEFGLSRKGLLKVGELEPGVIEILGVELDRFPKGKTENGVQLGMRQSVGGNCSASNHEANPGSLPPTPMATFLKPVQDGLEALFALRGLGWKFGTGTGIFIPKETRDTSNTHRFTLQTLQILFVSFLITDLLESSLKLVPGLGTPAGGSIFVFGSNPWETYAISTVIQAMTGFLIFSGINTVYYLVSFLCIVILHHEPTSWPPVFNYPWASTSLHDFWSRDWHQLLRQTFLVTGGYPLGSVFGTPGLVFGTFLASGCYHSWALYAMGRGTDIHCVVFFALQPVGFAIERLSRRITGRRVGGWFGTIWVWLWIIGGGQWCMNAWHLRGVAGGIIIPPFLSPTRLILFPILIRHIKRFL